MRLWENLFHRIQAELHRFGRKGGNMGSGKSIRLSKSVMIDRYDQTENHSPGSLQAPTAPRGYIMQNSIAWQLHTEFGYIFA